MIVRCGRCRAELEAAGPGEFLCPSCGTRNVIRGAPGQGTVDLGGLSVPGGPGANPPPVGPPHGVRWERCPACSYRFAMGEVDRVTCPNCRAELSATEGGLEAAPR